MTVAGIARVKDEADIIETTVRHARAQMDYVLVVDNASTDGTCEILRTLERECPRLVVDVDEEVGYYQSRQMTALADRVAYEQWGRQEWVVPFDADELWYAREREWGTVAQVLASLPFSESVAKAFVYDYRATALDRPDPNPVLRLQWRVEKPISFPKVAVRPVMPVTIEQGNHGANYGLTTPTPVLKVRHFPYRSAEQMIRKVRNGGAAYRATDLPDDFGAHWRGYDKFSDEEIAGIFGKWFYRARPTAMEQMDGENLPPLVHDPVVVDGRPL